MTASAPNSGIPQRNISVAETDGGGILGGKIFIYFTFGGAPKVMPRIFTSYYHLSPSIKLSRLVVPCPVTRVSGVIFPTEVWSFGNLDLVMKHGDVIKSAAIEPDPSNRPECKLFVCVRLGTTLWVLEYGYLMQWYDRRSSCRFVKRRIQLVQVNDVRRRRRRIERLVN